MIKSLKDIVSTEPGMYVVDAFHDVADENSEDDRVVVCVVKRTTPYCGVVFIEPIGKDRIMLKQHMRTCWGGADPQVYLEVKDGKIVASAPLR